MCVMVSGIPVLTLIFIRIPSMVHDLWRVVYMCDSTVVSMIISSILVSVVISGIPVITLIFIMITSRFDDLWRLVFVTIIL